MSKCTLAYHDQKIETALSRAQAEAVQAFLREAAGLSLPIVEIDDQTICERGERRGPSGLLDPPDAEKHSQGD
ncbi:MAG: hypothetical protein Aurels2KO_28050 [Aureliella sp.]